MSPTIAAVALSCVVTSLAPPAHAFELLAWWHRDLLEVELEPGDWARYALLDVSEEGAVTDTLTVTVLASDPGRVGATADRLWLRVEGRTDQPVDHLLVDVQALADGSPPLDALVRVVRHMPGGEWQEEDLNEHRESRLVQRHLEDPFREPTLERVALDDSVAHGHTLQRERVILTEVQREERPVGRNVLVIETDLRSVATLSAGVPLVGLLEARTVTLVRTSTQTADGKKLGRGAPPLLGERTLRCLDFGRLDPPPSDLPPR